MPNGAKIQPTLDPSRLIFIDETWTKTNMTRLYGWARGVIGWSMLCRTGTGIPRPSSPVCAKMA